MRQTESFHHPRFLKLASRRLWSLLLLVEVAALGYSVEAADPSFSASGRLTQFNETQTYQSSGPNATGGAVNNRDTARSYFASCGPSALKADVQCNGSGIAYPSGSAGMVGVIRVANPSALSGYAGPGGTQAQFNLPISVSYSLSTFRTPGIFNQAVASSSVSASAQNVTVSGSANSTNNSYSHDFGNSGIFSGLPEQGGSVSASLPITISTTGNQPVEIVYSVSVESWTLDLSGQADASANITATFSGLNSSSGVPLDLTALGITMTSIPSQNTDHTGCDDKTAQPCGPSCAMATYGFHTMLASLLIRDTPVGYSAPYGYPTPVTLSYTQRGKSQPGVFTYANFGPKWNLNWISFVTDDPADFTNVSGLARPGGGGLPVTYQGTSGGYHSYRLEGRPGMQLRRPSGGAISYEILHSDGSKDVYGQADGTSSGPRRVFLTQRIDPAGNATTVNYDAQMRITSLVDALGQATTLAYEWPSDPLKVTKVTDPFGRFATFSYDGAGRLNRITDVIGIQSAFTYEGSSDFINSLTTPYGTTTFANVVNGRMRRISATDPAGDTEVLESNEDQTPAIPAAEMAMPSGMNVYNSDLHLRNSFYWDKKRWREAANDYTKAYIYHWLLDGDRVSMSGYLASEKPPLQSRIWYSYPGQPLPLIFGGVDTRSQIGRVIEGGTQLTSRTVTALGKLASETDPLGRTTTWDYSSDGIDLLRVGHSQSTGPVTLAAYTYNAQHRPLTYTDAAGQVTTYTWNAVGQPLTATNAKNETTTFSYYAADAAGKQRKGRLYQIDGALPGNADIVTLDYDFAGNTAQVTGPDGYYQNFTFDALDRLTRVTFPDGTYTETIYQHLDPLSSRDRLGRLTGYVYNSIRQLVSVTDPANRTTEYGWCKCGDLQQLIDAMGRITTWRHDLAGRVTAKIYADGSRITYDYEPLSGRLAKITDEKQQKKLRAYNLDDTLAGLSYVDAEHPTPNVTFAYDADYRRIKTMVDGIGTTTYAYHPIAPGTLGAGRLASTDGPLPSSLLTYSYDELGRNVGYAINGVGETRTFDPLGRVLTAVNPLGTFGYTYVGATGRMDQVTYPSGMTCQYNYYQLNGDFRLKDIIHNLPGNTLLSRHSYDYNAVGNITRWTQISPQANLRRSWVCGYDTSDQLTSVISQDPDTFSVLPTGHFDYTYDPSGNRLTEAVDGISTVSTYNSLNQLFSISNSLSQQTFEWNAEDQLVGINFAETGRRSEFEYDGVGRRIGVIEKQGSSALAVRRFVWLGLQISEERDATGLIIRRRHFDRGIQHSQAGEPLVSRFFARDHLGSIRETVASNNTLITAYVFNPWGVVVSSGEVDDDNGGFTGHWRHVSGLVMAPFRNYNPLIGRWINRDPIEEAGGTNLYEYVTSTPTSLRDYLGLAATAVNDSEICSEIRKLANRIAKKGGADRIPTEDQVGPLADTRFHSPGMGSKEFVYTGSKFPTLSGATMTGSELSYIGTGYLQAASGNSAFWGDAKIRIWRTYRTVTDYFGNGIGDVPLPGSPGRYNAAQAGRDAFYSSTCKCP